MTDCLALFPVPFNGVLRLDSCHVAFRTNSSHPSHKPAISRSDLRCAGKCIHFGNTKEEYARFGGPTIGTCDSNGPLAYNFILHSLACGPHLWGRLLVRDNTRPTYVLLYGNTSYDSFLVLLYGEYVMSLFFFRIC